MSNAKNKHRNIRRGGHVKTVRYHDLLRARRTRNPLSGLNPDRVRRLYELYREGKYADVQLAWDALEEYDDMLGTVLNRRQSALGEMEWDVLIDARAVGEDAALQALAEEQQDFITRRLRAVENLSDAIKWLGLANFRRYSALEVLPAGRGEQWLPIHHWLLCRPALEGAWCYNENAETSCARVEPIDMSAVILREVARPIDLVAMFLISAKEAAIDGWDSFLEVFGNPALFFKMPPGTSDDQRDEYASIIKEISSDGAGVYPDGGEIHTVETSAANADAFSSRAEWCDKALVRRATGGLLTVLAESGSGTLAGSAHMEAFRQIAANDAISIAECINRQYVRRRLAAQYPGQPVLVYFTLTPPVINDRAATVNMLCQLAGQRWRATDEAVSEKVGVEVHTEDLRLTNDPSSPLRGYAEAGDLRIMNAGETPEKPNMPPVVVNRAEDPGSESPSGRFLRRGDSASEGEASVESPAESEPPLTEGELAAFAALQYPNRERMAQHREEVEQALREAADLDEEPSTPQSGYAEPSEVVVNGCNQHRHEPGCTGANLKKQKGGRGSGGGQHIPRHGKEGHTKPQRKEEQKRTEELPSDSVSKVLTDSDGHQYVRIPNHVKSWEDAEKILSAKIDLAVDKKGARIKGVPGKGVLAPGMKKEVFITKPGMKSMLSGAHTRRSSDKKAHFSAAASADQLWRASVFKSEEPDSRTNNPNLKIHRRTAEMRIGKQSYQVLLTAKIYSTKNNVSELHMVEIIK